MFIPPALVRSRRREKSTVSTAYLHQCSIFRQHWIRLNLSILFEDSKYPLFALQPGLVFCFESNFIMRLMHSSLSMKPPSTVPALILSAASKASTAAPQTPKGKTNAKTKSKHSQGNTAPGSSHSFVFRLSGLAIAGHLHSPHLPYLCTPKKVQNRLRGLFLLKQQRDRLPPCPLPPQRLPTRT
jgi:hypothetical protein